MTATMRSLLGVDFLQRARAAVPLDQAHPPQHRRALRDVSGRQHRHVARTIHHHSGQSPPNDFLPVVVGQLHADDVRLLDVHRNHRHVLLSSCCSCSSASCRSSRSSRCGRSCRRRRLRKRRGEARETTAVSIYILEGAMDDERLLTSAARGRIVRRRASISRAAYEEIDETGDLRIDGGIRQPDRGGRGGESRATRTATGASTLTRRIRLKALSEAIGVHTTKMPLLVLIGGIIGGLAGYLMQYYTLVIDYPLNVGGKPLSQLAGVHPDYVRVHGARRVAGGGVRDARAERLARTVSSGLQHAELCARLARPVFPARRERPTPSSNAEATASFLKSLGAREVTDVEH